MLKFIIIKFLAILFLVNLLQADSKIIKDGLILESKSYSPNEATLVVSNSNKIYICSIAEKLTKCILSKYNSNIN